MDVLAIKDCIDKFLETERPEVLALRGKWGVGKTYFWSNLISEKAKDASALSTSKYSYVSLFGVGSLETLKYSIFENSISNDIIGKSASIETLKENLQSLSTSLSLGKKVLNTLFKTKPLSGYAGVLESVAFLSVKETLICIDDLERKGDSLSLKDVLGLISFLKENRKCKFILLLNEDEQGMDEYQMHREKVIDIELTFAPTPDECAALAIKGDSDCMKLLMKNAILLGISNIRTLHKIRRLVRQIEPILEGLEEKVLQQAIRSIVLYCYCFYRTVDTESPTLHYVLENAHISYKVGEPKKTNPEHEKWKAILHTYGHRATDQFDRILARGVQAGYFAKVETRKLAEAKNNEVIMQNKSNEFFDAWDLYRNSFKDNESQLVTALTTSLKNSASTISPGNLNSTVLLLRELGKAKEATEIINHFLEIRNSDTGILNLQEYAFGEDITDYEIREKFSQSFAQINSKPSLRDVLERLSNTNGWSPIDEEVLAESTPKQYQCIFENEDGENLSSFVMVGLKFRNRSGGNDSQRKKIVKNVELALTEIAKSSKLNLHRVQRFGIELKDEK